MIAKSVTKCEVIAYEDLGAEAIRKMEVKDMPLIVAQDCHGGNQFAEGVKQYEKT